MFYHRGLISNQLAKQLENFTLTLEAGLERGDLLKLICDLVAHTVQIGVLITLVNHTWTADLHESTTEATGVVGNVTEQVCLT